MLYQPPISVATRSRSLFCGRALVRLSLGRHLFGRARPSTTRAEVPLGHRGERGRHGARAARRAASLPADRWVARAQASKPGALRSLPPHHAPPPPPPPSGRCCDSRRDSPASRAAWARGVAAAVADADASAGAGACEPMVERMTRDREKQRERVSSRSAETLPILHGANHIPECKMG